MVISTASIKCETIIDQMPRGYVGLRQLSASLPNYLYSSPLRLISLIEKWTSNVSSAVTQEQNRVGDYLLCVP
jgi:hypothetical protein